MSKGASVALSGVLMLLGIVLLFISPNLGMKSARLWMDTIGTTADMQTYTMVLGRYTDNFRLFGSLLIIAALVRVLWPQMPSKTD